MDIAQVDTATLKVATDAADFLAGKELRYWFAGLFILLVSAGLWLIRFLIRRDGEHLKDLTNQLSEQRQANAIKDKENDAKSERLLEYLAGDRTIMLQTIKDVSETQKRFTELMTRIETRETARYETLARTAHHTEP